MTPKFNLEFSTGNAAFENPEAEVARILKRVSERIADGEDSGNCVDINGNTVGWWQLELPEELDDDLMWLR